MKPLFWLLWVGCSTPQTGAAPECDSLCDELVSTCGLAAYPDKDSCLQGCGYNLEKGYDIEGQAACVVEAACDAFGIVECENRYAAP
jgi:hypothetical protein